MKYIKCLFFNLLIWLGVAQAQSNLVQNPSFEIFSSCPSSSGQVNFLYDWNNVSFNYFSDLVGTPDFLTTCGTSPLSVLPQNSFATLNAYEGNSVVALGLYNSDIPNFREYISTELQEPMYAKTTYQVKFHLTGGSIQNYKYQSHDFGVVFSESPLTQFLYNVITETPQITIDTLINTTQWVEYTFEITPQRDFSFITFGSFKPDNLINYQAVNFTTGAFYSLVYIDDISITNLTNQSIQKNTSDLFKVFYFDNSIHILNPEGLIIDFAHIFDMNGNKIYTTNQMDDEHAIVSLSNDLSPGMYFAQISSKGKISNYKLVITK